MAYSRTCACCFNCVATHTSPTCTCTIYPNHMRTIYLNRSNTTAPLLYMKSKRLLVKHHRCPQYGQPVEWHSRCEIESGACVWYIYVRWARFLWKMCLWKVCENFSQTSGAFQQFAEFNLLHLWKPKTVTNGWLCSSLDNYVRLIFGIMPVFVIKVNELPHSCTLLTTKGIYLIKQFTNPRHCLH